jgi:hypothetical protein
MADRLTTEDLDLILQALGYQKQAFADYKDYQASSNRKSGEHHREDQGHPECEAALISPNPGCSSGPASSASWPLSSSSVSR